MRRSLADPYSLGDEIPEWHPPEVPPETSKLRAAVAELERSLQPATPRHMQWCLNKLFVLPTRDGTAVKAAFQADNFIDACGHFPDDLWSAGTLEMLQSLVFRPSPAELFKALSLRFAQRQRMLERAKLMLGGSVVAEKPKAFVQDPADVRLRTMRDSLKRIGKVGRAARYERDLARLEGREVEDWAVGEVPEGTVAKEAAPNLPPIGPEVQARTLVALAKTWRKNGNTARAESLERQALALAPHVFEPAPERRDIPEDVSRETGVDL